MTDNEKLAMLRMWLGEKSDDNVLLLLLRIAGQKIIQRAYPYKTNITVVPPKYELLQLEIALNIYNKKGAEGQLIHNENGIERTYESADIPASLLNKVVPFAGVV